MRRVMSVNSVLQYLVITLACLVAFSRAAQGATRPSLPVQEVNVEVDAVGDAKATLTIRADRATIDSWKKSNIGGDAILRWTRLNNMWHSHGNVKISYAEPNLVHTEFTIAGLARRVGDEWEINLQQWCPDAQVTWADGKLNADADVDSNFGPMRREVTFTFAGVQGTPRVVRREKVYFAMTAPAAREGNAAKASFQLEVTPQIMACMAKSYGYEKFAKLWLARTSLKNTGDQTVSDFRVRFRLSDYASEWTPWSRTATIHPGQTVIDAYFPLMNIEKISSVQGRRQAVLEVEYEYRLGNGQVVHDVEGQKLEILGRNERMKTNLSNEEALTALDHNVFTPFILASFVTKDDPIIRMAAGRISGQSPNLSPGFNADDAVEFVKQIHRFMLANKIAYQTPPWIDTVQHYKYGREVLTNRAGTCVDLAIFYASVCEAVGLEPLLCTPPGHVFPMVRLPAIKEPADAPKGATPARNAFMLKYGALVIEIDGQIYLPIESTCLDPRIRFEEAVAIAKKTRLGMKPPLLQFDIAALRRQGVYALELPEPAANALDQIVAAPAGRSGAQPAPQPPAADPAKLIIGNWKCDVIIGGQNFSIASTYRDDGTLTGTIYNAMGQPVNTGGGKWSFTSGNNYHFSGGFEEDAVIRFTDDDTFVYTCGKSTNPLAIPGAQVTNRRVK